MPAASCPRGSRRTINSAARPAPARTTTRSERTRSTRPEQQRALRLFQQGGGGISEEPLPAWPAADAYDDEIVLAPLDFAEDGFVGGLAGEYRGTDAHVIAVGDCN